MVNQIFQTLTLIVLPLDSLPAPPTQTPKPLLSATWMCFPTAVPWLSFLLFLLSFRDGKGRECTLGSEVSSAVTTIYLHSL